MERTVIIRVDQTIIDYVQDVINIEQSQCNTIMLLQEFAIDQYWSDGQVYLKFNHTGISLNHILTFFSNRNIGQRSCLSFFFSIVNRLMNMDQKFYPLFAQSGALHPANIMSNTWQAPIEDQDVYLLHPILTMVLNQNSQMGTQTDLIRMHTEFLSSVPATTFDNQEVCQNLRLKLTILLYFCNSNGFIGKCDAIFQNKNIMDINLKQIMQNNFCNTNLHSIYLCLLCENDDYESFRQMLSTVYNQGRLLIKQQICKNFQTPQTINKISSASNQKSQMPTTHTTLQATNSQTFNSQTFNSQVFNPQAINPQAITPWESRKNKFQQTSPLRLQNKFSPITLQRFIDQNQNTTKSVDELKINRQKEDMQSIINDQIRKVIKNLIENQNQAGEAILFFHNYKLLFKGKVENFKPVGLCRMHNIKDSNGDLFIFEAEFIKNGEIIQPGKIIYHTGKIVHINLKK